MADSTAFVVRYVKCGHGRLDNDLVKVADYQMRMFDGDRLLNFPTMRGVPCSSGPMSKNARGRRAEFNILHDVFVGNSSDARLCHKLENAQACFDANRPITHIHVHAHTSFVAVCIDDIHRSTGLPRCYNAAADFTDDLVASLQWDLLDFAGHTQPDAWDQHYWRLRKHYEDPDNGLTLTPVRWDVRKSKFFVARGDKVWDGLGEPAAKRCKTSEPPGVCNRVELTTPRLPNTLIPTQSSPELFVSAKSATPVHADTRCDSAHPSVVSLEIGFSDYSRDNSDQADVQPLTHENLHRFTNQYDETCSSLQRPIATRVPAGTCASLNKDELAISSASNQDILERDTRRSYSTYDHNGRASLQDPRPSGSIAGCGPATALRSTAPDSAGAVDAADGSVTSDKTCSPPPVSVPPAQSPLATDPANVVVDVTSTASPSMTVEKTVRPDGCMYTVSIKYPESPIDSGAVPDVYATDDPELLGTSNYHGHGQGRLYIPLEAVPGFDDSSVEWPTHGITAARVLGRSIHFRIGWAPVVCTYQAISGGAATSRIHFADSNWVPMSILRSNADGEPDDMLGMFEATVFSEYTATWEKHMRSRQSPSSLLVSAPSKADKTLFTFFTEYVKAAGRYSLTNQVSAFHAREDRAQRALRRQTTPV